MTEPAKAGPVLELENVVKIYRLSPSLAALWGRPTRALALDGVSLVIRAGEFVGLTGPSGSGKSTLAALAAGERRATRGHVRRQGTVAYIPQDTDATVDPRLTVADLLGPARDETAFRDAGLPDFARFLDRPLATLSGGERQRVLLARALAQRPALLVADEPVSLVDVPTRMAILERLAERLKATRTALLYVTHDQAALAVLGGRLVTLVDGRVVEPDAAAVSA